MKKTLSIFLCLVILCSAFAGCSEKSKKDETKKATVVEQQLKNTYDSHYSDMDESVVRAYEKLCDAVVNHQQEVKFNTSMIDDINQLFYTSFPLYSLVDRIEFLDDKTGVAISYKYETEEHIKKVNKFNAAVNEIMTACKKDEASADEYLFNLYTYISSNVVIDNSVTTIMDTIISKKGISASISGMFEYLLLQADIPASHIINLNPNSVARMLSVASFGGEMYYFDISSEIEKTSGKGLKYFAMNTKRATFSKNDDFAYTDQTSVEKLENDDYSKLKNCNSFEKKENKVVAHCKDSKDFKFDLA